jgi:hypothetical protein
MRENESDKEYLKELENDNQTMLKAMIKVDRIN